MIEELDREITDSVPTPNALVAEVIRDIKRKELGLDVRHGTGKLLSESEGVVQENISASFLLSLGSGEFSMGWTEASDKRKNVKTGHSKQASKGSVTVVRTDGPDLTKEHKKGTWTRLPCRPNTKQMQMDKKENLGPKRKAEGEGCVEGGVIEVEKKQKVDDETKRLSVLFATHLGSVEFVGQPRWVQLVF